MLLGCRNYPRAHSGPTPQVPASHKPLPGGRKDLPHCSGSRLRAHRASASTLTPAHGGTRAVPGSPGHPHSHPRAYFSPGYISPTMWVPRNGEREAHRSWRGGGTASCTLRLRDASLPRWPLSRKPPKPLQFPGPGPLLPLSHRSLPSHAASCGFLLHCCPPRQGPTGQGDPLAVGALLAGWLGRSPSSDTESPISPAQRVEQPP